MGAPKIKLDTANEADFRAVCGLYRTTAEDMRRRSTATGHAQLRMRVAMHLLYRLRWSRRDVAAMMRCSVWTVHEWVKVDRGQLTKNGRANAARLTGKMFRTACRIHGTTPRAMQSRSTNPDHAQLRAVVAHHMVTKCGMSYAQVAALMHCRPRAVSDWMRRARGLPTFWQSYMIRKAIAEGA